MTARTSQPGGCWLDAFELPDYRGKVRRLLGPASLSRFIDPAGTWGMNARSLVAGPSAYVELYDSHDSAGSPTWLLPGQTVPQFDLLPRSEHLDSVRIFDREPPPGVSGYEAYRRAVDARASVH